EFYLTPKIHDTVTTGITERMIANGRIMALMPRGDMIREIRELASRSEARVTIIDAAGKVLADSQSSEQRMDSHLNRSEIQEARIKGQGIARRYSRTLQADMLYVAIAIGDKENIKGYVRLALSLANISDSIKHLYRTIYLTLFLISLPSLLLAFWFARNITAPIRQMAAFTRKLRAGQRPAPMLVDSGDELAQLAKDINHILEEQDEKVRRAQEEKSKLEAAFASMVEGALTLDRDNRIDQFNRSLRKMIGKRYEDILGKTPMEAFRSVALQDALLRFRESGQPVLQEIVLGDENPRILDVNITAIQGFPGEETKILMMFHNVTRLKQLERMRMDFVANVTHEIRTPLTAIIGYIETLQQGAVHDREKAEKFLQTIHNNAQRLNRLVDDLLTLSNIELGETKLHLTNIAVAEVVTEALKTIQPHLTAKKLRTETDIAADTPAIRADQDKMMQILLNILDNAVKFTPEEGRIRVAAASANGSLVAIRIIDTGIGIPKSEIPRLGERFYRVEKTRSRDLGGTGLGLSIVKHLMLAHGGHMEIESNPGYGTTVSLYFPASIPGTESLNQP
ncbi:MAG: ATP-binding protein, partial [Deltaproteobacteria bacterium]|nr:ATP-binding protein [Deltaproteobacteria bacterium]